MAGKITPNEFQKWSEQLIELAKDFRKATGLTETEKDIIFQFVSIYAFFTRRECTIATISGLVFFNTYTFDKDIPQPILDNLTFKEWGKNIGQKLKDHCIAEGYYNPNNPPNLTLLKQQGNEVRKKFKDKHYLSRILAHANSEDYKTITTQVSFWEQVDSLTSRDDNDNNDIEIPAEIAFIIEDTVGRIKKLIAKVEAENQPNQPVNTPPPPISNSNYQNNLENEISDLKNQICELENKLNSSSNTSQVERDTYQKMLDDIRRKLGEKEKKKQKNKNQPEQKNKNNDNNLLLILGLGGGNIFTPLNNYNSAGSE